MPIKATPEEITAVRLAFCAAIDGGPCICERDKLTDICPGADAGAEAIFSLLPKLGFDRRAETLEKCARMAERSRSIANEHGPEDVIWRKACEYVAFAIRSLPHRKDETT